MRLLNGTRGMEYCQQQLFIYTYSKLWQLAYFKAKWGKTKLYMISMFSFPINLLWQYNLEKNKIFMFFLNKVGGDMCIFISCMHSISKGDIEVFHLYKVLYTLENYILIVVILYFNFSLISPRQNFVCKYLSEYGAIF